jgi:hypothetical protein
MPALNPFFPAHLFLSFLQVPGMIKEFGVLHLRVGHCADRKALDVWQARHATQSPRKRSAQPECLRYA